ncbi:MAG: allantoinase PuuE [Pseudomonadota bacterium]
MTDETYPRDLLGYGAQPPDPQWPGGARIAVQIVLNFEEGAENSVLHGDQYSETFLSEIVGAQPYAARHMSMETLYEYGTRAGFWRLYRLFERYQVPVTVFGVAMALQRHPQAVEAMLNADWEIASHAYRWVDHQFMEAEEEAAQIAKAIDIHTEVTGVRPLGWYTGRDSPNTRRLVHAAGGFAYDSDAYNDDLPFWHPDYADHLIVPYTLDANDMRFATAQGFHTAEQFFTYLRDTFDYLYAEGEHSPKMMSVGLHCRIAGRPGRAIAVQRFLEHIRKFDRVWLARRIDIAQHWRNAHPPPA